MRSIVEFVSQALGNKLSPRQPSPARRERDSFPADSISVVGLLKDRADRQTLETVCAQNRWPVRLVESCTEAQLVSERLRAPVILCDRDSADRDWRDAVALLASSPHRACVLLVSEVLDDYLWTEVVRMGGYDVLCKPLREEDALGAIRLAWTYWKSDRASGGARRRASGS